MTAAALEAFVAEARAEVDAALEAMDVVDADALPPPLRRQFDEQRERLLELLASLADEASEAKLEASMHAGRELTPAEVRGLVLRQ